MKIAIVVHGRFHAFDLARALIDRGHDVTVFTNYPRFACRRFGLPGDRVRGFWAHGALARGLHRVGQWTRRKPLEASVHSMFGRWAADQLGSDCWDVLHVFSGVAEELLTSTHGKRAIRVLMRGSSHIRTQARLLEEEEARAGVPIDRPSPWMIAREEREYELADQVLVPSQFAYDSFREQGFPAEKLIKMVLGVEVDSFRSSPEAVQGRCARIASGAPLRVLYVGALLYRKGMIDLGRIFQSLDGSHYRFTLVGPPSRESAGVLSLLADRVEIVPKQSQHRLKEWYQRADVFIFPTVEDGFAQVLAQAHAAGLPILTTRNSAGRDLIQDGETGWVLPIRSPQAFVERLLWCDAHRKELAEMTRRIHEETRLRTWDDAARDFEATVEPLVRRRQSVTEGPTTSAPFKSGSEHRSESPT